MAEVCLIDTSAWIDFFRGREPVASHVDTLLAEGSAAVCGMVELEIRQGLRCEETNLLSLLGSTLRLETREEDYARAGDALASLRRKGITLPATDGLIAHVAMSHEARLLEHDDHFKSVEGLTCVIWRNPES